MPSTSSSPGRAKAAEKNARLAVPTPLLRRSSTPMVKRTKTYTATGHHLRRFRELLSPELASILKRDQKEDTDTTEGQEDGPLRGQQVNIAINAIMDTLHPDEHRYPVFDSLDEHDLDEQSVKEMHEREAWRLLDAAAHPTQFPQLEQMQFFTAMKGDRASDYHYVSDMAQNISMALSLCQLENECINLRHCRRIASRERLQRHIKKARAVCAVADNEAGSKLWRTSNSLKECIFALVDYISAIIAHLVSQMAVGDYWLVNVLSVLVAQTTKIKVLLTDLVEGAAIAESIGEAALERSRRHTSPTADDDDEREEDLYFMDAEIKDGLTSRNEADVANYCINQNKFLSGINLTIENILLSLYFLNRSGLPPTSYEMCVVVYEIGFEGFMTVLHQDRDLEYAASSDRAVLNTAQAAFIMVDGILSRMKERSKQPSASSSAVVEWSYRDHQEASSNSHDEIRQTRISLRHMADILAIMVPLSATSPIVLSNLTKFRTMLALSGGVQDIVTPFADGRFDAFCRLCTADFDREDQNKGILRLSKAYSDNHFSRSRMLADGDWNAATSLWGSFWSSGESQAEAKAETEANYEAKTPPKLLMPVQPTGAQIRLYLADCSDEMAGWTADEDSVTVDCSYYIWSVTASAMTIVAGGLVVGFSIGDRISGVDPFNLANYAWLAAAFFLLICKSVLVRQWEWSDFLRRRVRCRSVSELANTTGIHEQLIIAWLLHEDCSKSTSSILTTRGPYNSLFRRQATGGGGFSIDRPIQPSTMMLSGIVLLKVFTPKGDAIVCLDCRRGTELVFFEHNSNHEVERLVCDDLTPLLPGSSDTAHSNKNAPPQLRLTKTKNFTWKRMQGLYEFNNREVVFI